MTRTRRALIGTVVSLAAASGALACGGEETAAGCEDFRFEAAAWRAEASNDGAPGELTERQRLADRLIECRYLVGDSQAELRETLGAPDIQGEDGYWYFDLGPDRDAGLDREQLEVKFDDSGQVTRTGLATF